MGNVRELKSALEFAFVVAETGPLLPDHLPNQILYPMRRPERHLSPPAIGTLEKKELIAALRKAGGNRSETARILGVTRATVWNRIRSTDSPWSRSSRSSEARKGKRSYKSP